MSDNKRIGRQFPTQSVVLEYSDTKGGEAILLYEQSTRRLMPWQQEIDRILAKLCEDVAQRKNSLISSRRKATMSDGNRGRKQ